MINEIDGLFELVDTFFNDEEKTMLWVWTENVHLGGLYPEEMIRLGRIDKLKNWIINSLDKNS